MKRTTYLIISAMAMAAAPHILHVPPWVFLWMLLLWGYNLLSSHYFLYKPGRRIILLFTAAGFGITFLSLGIFSVRLSAINLLLIMAGLKPFEIRNRRDQIISVFIAYFIIISNLFFSTTLMMTLYLFISVMFSTTVLISVNHPEGTMASHAKTSAVILLQALPLMLILFFAFPRIHGSLFSIGNRSGQVTGFSSSLTPGAVTDIVMNRDVAFRVQFDQQIPRSRDLYFRGIVFSDFDGRTWRRIKPDTRSRSGPRGKQITSYVITMEPQGKRWMFALDIPSFAPRGARLLSDDTIHAMRDINQTVQYRMDSLPRTRRLEKKQGLPKYLALPVDGNRKAYQLGESWKKTEVTPTRIIAMGLAYFRENDFFYTLRPPVLVDEVVDRFLFEARRGYCEHYAAAFAYLMRAAGIPARVVGGYLGGEINHMGNYVIVRQSDAHAWVELYLEDRGWTRIDPTSAIAPNRIERSMISALPPDEVPGFLISPESPTGKLLKKIALAWDAANFNWNKWVLGYSRLRQINLFSRIGINLRAGKGIVAAIAATLLLLLLVFWGICFLTFKRKPTHKDRAWRIYEVFCRKMKKAGISRPGHMGPMDFAKEASLQRIDLSEEILNITDIYIAARYGHGIDMERRLSEAVKDFSP